LYLEESKKKAEAEQSDKKRKEGRLYLTRLMNRKRRKRGCTPLQQDISSLEASADTLLTKAETKHVR